MKKLIILFLISLATNYCYSQDAQKKLHSTSNTIDGVVNDALTLITGKKGETRDWEAFRNLFTGDAQIAVLVHDPTGPSILRTYSLEEFVRIGKKYYQNDGFIEYEIKKIVNEYNGIANVFQSYYAKELDYEEKGINSYQLVYFENRWWIKSLLWTSDRNGVQIPENLNK